MTDCYLLPVGKKESIPKISTLQDLEHWVSKTAVRLKKKKQIKKYAIHLTEFIGLCWSCGLFKHSFNKIKLLLNCSITPQLKDNY